MLLEGTKKGCPVLFGDEALVRNECWTLGGLSALQHGRELFAGEGVGKALAGLGLLLVP